MGHSTAAPYGAGPCAPVRPPVAKPLPATPAKPPFPVVRVYAKVAITDAQGGVLMLRRSSTHRSKAGRWDLPGGIVNVESGERGPRAARREATEETGLVLGPVTAVGMFTDRQRRRESEAWSYCIGILCIAQVRNSAQPVRLSSEHDAYRWVTGGNPHDDAILADLAPKYRNLAQVARARRRTP